MYVYFLQACCYFLQSWVSKKFMTGWWVSIMTYVFINILNILPFSLTSGTLEFWNFSVVLFPVAVTFFVTWWFIQFVDGFFSPLYEQLGFDIFGNSKLLTLFCFKIFSLVFATPWLTSSSSPVFGFVLMLYIKPNFYSNTYCSLYILHLAVLPICKTLEYKVILL